MNNAIDINCDESAAIENPPIPNWFLFESLAEKDLDERLQLKFELYCAGLIK